MVSSLKNIQSRNSTHDVRTDVFIYFTCLLTILIGLATFSNLINNYAYAQYSSQLTQSGAPPLQATINDTGKDHTLDSVGSSTTQVIPDRVVLTLGVQTVNKTASAVAATNSETMNKIIHALLAAGVRQNETRTSSFSISPNYNSSQGRNNITGFTATNSIQIDSNNTANIAMWIDTAVSKGANSVESIDFKLSDKKLTEVKNSLIPLAVKDAKNKANIAASATGLKVLGVKSITMNEFRYPAALPQQQPLGASVSAKATPILAGQEPVSDSITMVFLIG
jgi:uncharacterized protein YggE